jgi:enamine deaminase RidA (YjgF/YER057c/UK114 family)
MSTTANDRGCHGLANIETALAAAGAGFEHVIKWSVFVVEGQPIQAGYEAFQRVWGDRSTPPPLITAAFVAGLGHPDWLAEIDVIAVVPA